MSSTISTQKKRSELRMWLITGLIAAGVVLSFVWNWQRIVNHTPAITLPAPVMPATNAYDTYLKAHRAMQDVTAIDSIVFNNVRRRIWTVPSFTMRKSLIEHNAAALALAREGLRQTYRQPPIGSHQDTSSALKFRHIAELFALDTNVKMEEGDWYGALNSRLDQIAFSESLYWGAGTTGMVIGESCQKRQLPSRGDIIAHLNLQQSQSAIKRLEEILSRRCPLSEMLLEDKRTGVNSIDTMFRDDRWRDDVTQNRMNPAWSSGSLATIKQKAGLIMVDKRSVIRSYAQYMDQCAEIARVPLYKRPAYPTAPSDPINQYLAEDFHTFDQMDAQEENANKLFLLKIALHCYHLQNGRYPKQLSDLAPAFISRLPENPLGANGLFGYQISGDTFILFNSGAPSVGAKSPQGTSGL